VAEIWGPWTMKSWKWMAMAIMLAIFGDGRAGPSLMWATFLWPCGVRLIFCLWGAGNGLWDAAFAFRFVFCCFTFCFTLLWTFVKFHPDRYHSFPNSLSEALPLALLGIPCLKEKCWKDWLLNYSWVRLQTGAGEDRS
jgi:hypothetical protein